jgi:hypothetical protein
MKKRYATTDLTTRVKEKIMSLSQVETHTELENELQLLEQEATTLKKEERKRALVGWTISLSMHAILFLLMTSIAFTMIEKEDIEAPPVRVAVLPTPPPKKVVEEHKIRELLEKTVLVETEQESNDKGPVTILELPTVVDSTTEDEKVSEQPKGREEAISDMEMGSTGVMSFIGVGGGSAGMFGNRSGSGKVRAKSKMGPYGKSADGATETGLRWLMRHQSPNGMWSASRYYLNCTLNGKCEPGKEQSGDEDAAMTGYAVLCFLGAGYDHKSPNKFRKVVKNGVEYLLTIQKPDGIIGERNYEHAVSTMALVEAYGISNDPDLRKPAQKAVDALIARQAMLNGDEYKRLGWDYVNANSKRNDLSVSGWCIMALKSAHGAGLNIGESMNGAKEFINKAWKSANPDWDKKTDPYKDVTVFPYCYNGDTNVAEKDHLSFVGATCAVFLGHKSGDPMLETLLNDSEKRWIDNGMYKRNSYAVYYLGMSQFQAGGDRWQKYLNVVIPYAIDAQKKTEDCYDGSWDWEGQTWHGSDTGRVLTTCYNILNLEVAYRYAQVNGIDLIKKK